MKLAYVLGSDSAYRDEFFAGLKLQYGADKYYNTDNIKQIDKYDIIFVEGIGKNAIKASQLEHKNVMIRTTGVELYVSKVHHVYWPNVKWLLAYSQYQIDYFKEVWCARRCEAQNYGVLPQVALPEKFLLKTQNHPDNIAVIANITGRKNLQEIPVLLERYKTKKVFHLGKVCAYGAPIMDYIRYRTRRDKVTNRYFYQKIIDYGRVDNWLNQMNYIWLPSIQESFNRSICEGMLKGMTPIIKHFGGAETLWPSEFLYDNVSEIGSILRKKVDVKKMRQYVIDRYGINKILERFNKFIT